MFIQFKYKRMFHKKPINNYTAFIESDPFENQFWKSIIEIFVPN